jgi:LisH domain-containing protein ARMC9
MINDDIISWLIDKLEDTDVLSDYTLEYAVALLMNLVMRSGGKAKSALNYKKTLKVVSDLVGNTNNEVFINSFFIKQKLN